MRVLFTEWFPHKEKAEVKRLLRQFRAVIPAWVNTLTISWDDSLSAIADMTVSEEYRAATMRLGTQWMTNPEHHEKAVLHELCHLYTCPLQALAIRLVQEHHAGPSATLLEESIRRASERATEDLADAFMKVI